MLAVISLKLYMYLTCPLIHLQYALYVIYLGIVLFISAWIGMFHNFNLTISKAQLLRYAVDILILQVWHLGRELVRGRQLVCD